MSSPFVSFGGALVSSFRYLRVGVFQSAEEEGRGRGHEILFFPYPSEPGQKAFGHSGMGKVRHAIYSGENSVIGAPNR